MRRVHLTKGVLVATEERRVEFTYMRPEVTLRMSTRKLSSMNLNRVPSPVVRCIAIGESSMGRECVCVTDICLHCKRPSEVNTSVDCDDSIEDELGV